MKAAVAVVAAVLFGMLAPAMAPATAGIVIACGTTITSDTTLSTDVGPCPLDGVIVGADNLTLDLNGHRIFGTAGTGDGGGVVVRQRQGVTVRNGTVSDFDGGVVIVGGSANTVSGITAVNNIGASAGHPPAPATNYSDGILIQASSGNRILGNHVENNGPLSGIGLIPGDSDHPSFPPGPVTNNLVQGNTVINNVACRLGPFCDNDGIRIEPGAGPGNRILRNTVTGNGLDGIALFNGVTRNIVAYNTVNNNGFQGAAPGDGLRIFGSDNVVKDNTANGNNAGGVSVGARTGGGTANPPNGRLNRLIGNRAAGNGVFDLWDSIADCDQNLWSHNQGVTVFPFCTLEKSVPPPADFTGDGRTDVSVYRPGSGAWFVQGGATLLWGTTGDIPVPADYDGDATTDIAVFRPSTGQWFINGINSVFWGTSGDIPVPADYDGDGDDDLAVFRPSTGVWFVEGGLAVAWGTAGDIPVPGDYDGDRSADVAVFRPSTGVWFVEGGPTLAWGTAGDIPVPGDYDGDGTTDPAVFRPSSGVWLVEGGPTAAFGTAGDIPVPGDYDRDGDTDFAVFRPATGVWFVQGGTTTAWGTAGDVPLPLPDAIRRFFFPPL
jgi:parallel beta-helix repeat protein